MQENFARQEHERRRQLSKKRATGRFGEAGFSRFPRKRRQAQKSTEDTSGYHIFSKVQHPAQHVRVSGLIVAAARRRPPLWRKCAVWNTTGHAMADTSYGVERAGCDAYVVKPCLPEDLVKAISEILESALQLDPDLPPV